MKDEEIDELLQLASHNKNLIEFDEKSNCYQIDNNS